MVIGGNPCGFTACMISVVPIWFSCMVPLVPVVTLVFLVHRFFCCYVFTIFPSSTLMVSLTPLVPLVLLVHQFHALALYWFLWFSIPFFLPVLLVPMASINWFPGFTGFCGSTCSPAWSYWFLHAIPLVPFCTGSDSWLPLHGFSGSTS